MDFSLSRRYIELHTPSRSISKRLELDGIKYDASGVRFERELYKPTQAAILSASLIGEPTTLELREQKKKRKPYSPGSSDLALINQNHATQVRELEDFHIFQRVPVNNIPSRTVGIRFTQRALDKFVLDAKEGRARLRSHNKADVVGRVFDAEVIEEEVRGINAKWLLTTEYISARTLEGNPMNEELITQVVNGEFSYDSIGFYPGSAVQFKDMETNEGSVSIIEIDYDAEEQFPIEMREISFVHLGELRGVGSRMNTHESVDVPDSLYILGKTQAPEDVSRTHETQKNLSTWDILM